jgi:hypothetical protein
VTALAGIPHLYGTANGGGSPLKLMVSDHASAIKGARFLMLTWEDDVEVHALRKRGWTISAIARHTGRDRKTIRAYLNGTSTPGVRRRHDGDPFEPFLDYVTARLADDPHLWLRRPRVIGARRSGTRLISPVRSVEVALPAALGIGIPTRC